MNLTATTYAKETKHPDSEITIIFSKNRPLQLDLTLTSNEIFCKDRKIGNEVILYKATTERFEIAYRQVAKEHPNTIFIKEEEFKRDLLALLDRRHYVLFIVDDCVFTHPYSLDTICTFLDICEGVLGFSLRLGSNTKICYPIAKENSIPYMQAMGNGINAFSWKEAGEGDFSYPLEVSSSAYRYDDLKLLLESLPYTNPNTLEWMLSLSTQYFSHKQFMLCFENSVAFCNPINRVEPGNTNRSGINPRYSTENLLNLYEAGYRIDYTMFENFVSNGAHQEVDIDFISKKSDRNGYGEYR